MGNIIKTTDIAKKTLNPLFDKIFNFEFQNMKRTELEMLRINIEVRDRTFAFLPYVHTHLGGYEIDLTSVYFNTNHMYNKTWFTLFDFDEEFEGCMGFVNATIEVLGPGDEPTILEAITDDPSVEKTVISSKIRPRGHLIMAEIYRAEFLSPIGVFSRKLDPYVRVKYGGIEKQTKKIEDTSNPEFNQIIFLSAILPNHSKHVFVQLWHDAFLSDSLLGTAMIPFNKFKNSNNQKPEWINIYGPSISSNNEFTKSMAQNGFKTGTTFRGRILIRFSSRDEEKPISDVIRMNYRVPELTIPNPLTRIYTLRLDIFEGNVLPSDNRGILHISLGNYYMKSELKSLDDNKSIIWNHSLDDRKIALPVDINQIPDLIIYFADEDAESHRISYFRINAKKIIVADEKSLKKKQEPLILKFKEDKSHKLLKPDQFPGFAVARIMLFAYTPTPRTNNRIIITSDIGKKKYKVLLFIYVARKLASGEDDGTSNPQVEFKSGGRVVKTNRKNNTLNPDWYERLVLDVEIPDVEYTQPPTVTIMMNHIKLKNGTEVGKSLLGRYWLLLRNKNDTKLILNRKTQDSVEGITYCKPQWIPLIYDKEDRIDGRLLMSYAVIPEKCFEKVSSYLGNSPSIIPKNSKEELRLYAFGIRDLKKYNQKIPKNVSFKIKINSVFTKEDLKINDGVKNGIVKNLEEDGENMLITENKVTTVELSNKGLQLNKHIDFIIRVPHIKELCPIMEVFAYEENNGSEKLIGIGHYPLFKTLAYFYGDEEDKEYIEKWNDFFHLDKMSKVAEDKKRVKAVKVQRLNPQNKLLYFEDLIFEIKDPVSIRNKRLISRAEEETHVKNFKNKEMKLMVGGEGESPYKEFERQPILNRKDLKINMEEIPEVNEEHNIQSLFEEKDSYESPGQDETTRIKEVKEGTSDPLSNNQRDSDILKGQPESPDDKQKDTNPPVNNPLMQILGQNALTLKVDKVRHAVTKDEYKTNEEDMEKLYLNVKQDVEIDLNNSIKEEKEISNFELETEENINEKSNELSVKEIAYNDVFIEENEDAKHKRKQVAVKSFMSKFKTRNLLSGLFKRKKDKQIDYQDYDTDEEEDYDDVLPYLKGRMEFQDDLEDVIFTLSKKAVDSVQLHSGNQRDEAGFFEKSRSEIKQIGDFKFLFVRANRPDLVSPGKISSFLTKVTRSHEFVARVYILRGLQITSLIDKDNPKTYLRFIYNHDHVEVDKDSLREGLYPEYYRTKKFHIQELPGTAKLRIEIWEQVVAGGVMGDMLLGYTEIDLEERHFSIKWNTLEKKPVEKRNIKNDLYGSRGRLEMWIEILPFKTKEPFTVIYPKLQLPYELRCIVWSTEDCVFKDEITKANDIFARGGVKRGDNFLETDTHWRCRAKGSFNWRWKFEVQLPVDENKNYGEDKFMIQLWDRDLIARNDLIGEFEIDLNTHKMLKKANIRRKAVEMRLREKGTGNETNMIWYNVYHPEKVDVNGNKIMQGRVLLTFECLPKDLSEKFKNGIGRAEPNFFPTLPDPVGRFSFDILSPWSTIKALLGPELCYKIVCWCCVIIWIIILILVGYLVLPAYLGITIANAIN